MVVPSNFMIRIGSFMMRYTQSRFPIPKNLSVRVIGFGEFRISVCCLPFERESLSLSYLDIA